MNPTDMLIVVPSRLGVGEVFSIKVKLRGELREIPCQGQFCTKKPGLGSPFNLNVQRQIRYVDDCPPEWSGSIEVRCDGLDGPSEIVFDGTDQGAFPGDTRPIKCVDGFSFSKPGFRFVELVDRASGLTAWSNAVLVTPEPPARRIFWGDPHWQSFFSDGIRCPEELYAFARNEGFLDFGAVSDHIEALTERQWDYFQAVTNDYNEPGRFVTLVGQEWTHHDKAHGAPGHRNIYYRGSGGPALRSNDPRCNTLEKLWARLDSLTDIEAIAIPHHSANTVMGTDWDQGWNPTYETCVEIYSVWGNSERPAEAGNPRPIRKENLGGEMAGRHVVDALKRGYRLGFVGGGDVHDGRPGDAKHNDSYPPKDYPSYQQGFTAVMTDRLTRESVFDAIREQRTYATTASRIYLDVSVDGSGRDRAVTVQAASPDGIRTATVAVNGEDHAVLKPGEDNRVLVDNSALPELGPDGFAYVRIDTVDGEMAWSSPVWSQSD